MEKVPAYRLELKHEQGEFGLLRMFVKYQRIGTWRSHSVFHSNIPLDWYLIETVLSGTTKKKRNGSLVYIHLYVLSRLEWSWKLPISDIIVTTRYQCLLSFKTNVGQSLWYLGSSSSASLSSLLEYADVYTGWVFLKLIIAVIGIEIYSQSRHWNTKLRLAKMKYKIYNSGNSTAQPYLIQLSDTSCTWQ